MVHEQMGSEQIGARADGVGTRGFGTDWISVHGSERIDSEQLGWADRVGGDGITADASEIDGNRAGEIGADGFGTHGV